MSLSYFFYLLICFPYFLLALFLACFIPGNVILKKIKLPFVIHSIVSLGLGIVLWGWQGYIFGYLQIRWMSYLYLFFFFVRWLLTTNFTFQFSLTSTLKIFTKNKTLTFLMIVGMFVQLASVWFVGVNNQKGFYSCCGDSRDNLVQIAITKALVESIPPKEPGITGFTLKNYHYWSGLINAELVRVFHLPLIPTEYQYMTIMLSLMLAIAGLALSKSLKLSTAFSFWLIFFLYFGGDFMYGIVFFLTHQWTFSLSSLEDGTKFLINYPRGFAIVLFFIALVFLVETVSQKKNTLLAIATTILMGSLIGYKVYVGIFALVGMWFYCVFCLKKRVYRPFWMAFFTTCLSALIYIPVNAGAGGLYFTGFWRFENLMVLPYINKTHFELARLIYVRDKKWLKVVLYELLYIIIYLIGIFGTKLLGVIQNKKSFKLFPQEVHIFLLSGILVSAVLGFFFEQQSGTANTFNFLVSIFIIGSLYTALTCSYFLSKLPRVFSFFLIGLIIFLTIPRIIYETSENMIRIQRGYGFFLADEQITFLSSLNHFIPQSAQLLVDHNGAFSVDHESPYVYIFSGGNMYLSGVGNEIDSHNIPATLQEATVKTLITEPNPCIVGKTLLAIPARYIISDRENYFYSTVSAQFINTIHANSTYKLYYINVNSIMNFLRHPVSQRGENLCKKTYAFPSEKLSI